MDQAISILGQVTTFRQEHFFFITRSSLTEQQCISLSLAPALYPRRRLGAAMRRPAWPSWYPLIPCARLTCDCRLAAFL